MCCRSHLRPRSLTTACLVALVLWTVASKARPPKAASQSRAEQLAAEAAEGLFEPSLHAMENVDFLLTPALLLQDALLDDVVNAYPAE